MKQKSLFAASLIFGLMFINAGLNKFFNYIPLPLAAILIWVLFENREKYFPLID